MFNVTSKHVAKQLGNSTLHPVSDLNSAERFRPMCIVVQKESFWFWKKPKMIPTQITLDSLFEKKLDIPEAKTSTLLEEKFLDTVTLKLEGKVGANIANELNLSSKASHTMDLTMNLDGIQKSQMDWNMMEESLNEKPMNNAHKFLREVKNAKRTKLCVVLESLSTKAGGNICGEIIDGAAIEVNVPKVIPVGAEGRVEKKQKTSFSIPQGTVLAYSCHNFSIDEQGYASLDYEFSARTNDDPDDPELLILTVVEEKFKALTTSDRFAVIRAEFKNVLEFASDDMLSSMHQLLCAAEFKIENKSEEKAVKASTFSKLFEDGGIQQFKTILKHLGFMIPDDWKAPDASVEFPEADVNLLKSVISLLDVLQDFEINIRTLLSNISVEHMKIISNIVTKQITYEVDEFLEPPDLRAMFTKEPSSRLLLKYAGLVDDDDNETFEWNEDFDLQDFYVVVYFFSF